jgi:anti-sigma factor RsiW
MTCREFAAILIDFVADELPEDARRRIEQHLQECPPCVTYIETYQLTIRWTRQLPCDGLSPDLERRLRAAVEQALSEGDGTRLV